MFLFCSDSVQGSATTATIEAVISPKILSVCPKSLIKILKEATPKIKTAEKYMKELKSWVKYLGYQKEFDPVLDPIDLFLTGTGKALGLMDWFCGIKR